MISNSDPPADSPSFEVSSKPKSRQRSIRLPLSLLTIAAAVTIGYAVLPKSTQLPVDPAWDSYPAPLVMRGGDPYLRALMRTISASESNSARPYSLLYGGEHFSNLSQHPDECVPIVSGPNVGDCTTAAGRYQFITTTWLEKAAQYHPSPKGLWFLREFSFSPDSQDEVVYRWLNDPEAWGIDLAQLLRQERLTEVLEILSPTWTSLGYGIEPNSMTDLLPQIYQQVLAEELQAATS